MSFDWSNNMVKKTGFWLLFLVSIFWGQSVVLAENRPPAIIQFSANVDEISFVELETGEIPIIFSWKTLFVNDEHNLQLKAYQLDQWVILGENLPANGELEIDVQHPQTFGAPMFQ